MKTEHTPDTVRAPFARYAHAISVPADWRILFASGQLGVTPGDALPEGARAQAEQCFANVEAILRDAGMTRDAILRVNAYVTDRAHMAGYMAARDAFFADVSPPPASTLMIVGGFTRPEFLVEVEVIAAAPTDGESQNAKD